MTALFIAAIHNGELSDSPAAETLRRLREAWPDSVVREIVEQPPIDDSPDTSELLSWGNRQWNLESRWRHHRKRHSPLREAVAEAGFVLWKFRLRLSSTFRSRSWRVRQIEAAVSAKHHRAWSEFAGSQASTALVIESDATWALNADDRLSAVIDALPSATPAYVNLAGGLSDRRLDIGALSVHSNEHKPGGVRKYEPAVTNTSCAYLINRPMAQLLVSYLRSQPDDRVLGIDWLVNAAFMQARESDQKVVCWHSYPPILIHGSLMGLTQSWHPDR